MAKGRLVGRIEAVLGLIGIIALVVTYAILAHWNPFPSVVSWLDSATATTLAKPAPPWTVRAGNEPDTATVLPSVIVVTADGSVEARNPGDGGRLWTQEDSWAAVAGDTRPVVIVGRPIGGGFDVDDAVTGAHLWSDDNRDAIWPYRNMVLVFHCAHDFACTLTAKEPSTGHPVWSLPLGGGASMHGLGKPFASLRPITDDYTKSLGAIPVDVPALIGLNLDGDIHVISTSRGNEVHVYRANQDQRVVVAGRNVLVTTSTLRAGGCTYTIEAHDAATNATLWSRTGYNPRTSSGLACDQRNDPLGGGGVFLATDPTGRDALVSIPTGKVVYRAPSGAHVITTDGNIAVVRLADKKTLLIVSAHSGAGLWRRVASQDALVGIGPDGVMIADPPNNRLVITTPTTGGVLINAQSGATILGVGPRAVILNVGRSFGPILVPTMPTVHP
jgi:outer membrane protein assembly factor BamB